MPNEILTRAIDAVASGEHLDRRPCVGGARRDHGGTRERGPDRGVPDRAARQGRDRRRAGRPRAHDARPGRRGRRGSRRPRRHRGHRRRADDVQHLDDGGAHRCGSRLRGRQARQSLGDEQVRIRGRARGARRRHRARPGRRRRLHRRDRLRLHVRSAPPRGDEARRAGPQGARRADDLQLPRSVDESRGRLAPAARGLGPPLPGDDRGGARRPRLRACASS